MFYDSVTGYFELDNLGLHRNLCNQRELIAVRFSLATYLPRYRSSPNRRTRNGQLVATYVIVPRHEMEFCTLCGTTGFTGRCRRKLFWAHSSFGLSPSETRHAYPPQSYPQLYCTGSAISLIPVGGLGLKHADSFRLDRYPLYALFADAQPSGLRRANASIPRTRAAGSMYLSAGISEAQNIYSASPRTPLRKPPGMLAAGSPSAQSSLRPQRHSPRLLLP
ncbi:hypothetical protein C8R44DRAFT_6687 [Mycena epipterygia]|nr:hypothetical protein C8R44DRAFT_6687 [Mycena epipterygia]